jgi:hypothetical protein
MFPEAEGIATQDIILSDMIEHEHGEDDEQIDEG